MDVENITNPCIWGTMKISKTIKANCAVLLAIDTIPTLLTIVLNIIFMTTLIKTKSLHIPSNVFLGALCFSDILVGIIVQPIFIAYQIAIVANYEPYLLRVLLRYSVIVVSGLSFIFVSFVTADRYFAICHPFQYKQKASCRLHLAIAFIGGVSYTTIVAVMLIERNYHFEGIVLLYMLLSFVGMIVSYARIHKVAAKKRNAVISVGPITDEEVRKKISYKKKERSKTYIIAIILCFLILCYTPFAAMSIAAIIWRDKVCKSRETTVIASLWVTILTLVNSCINPLIYFVRSKEFRLAARSLFRVGKDDRVVSNNSNGSKSNTEEVSTNKSVQ